MKDSEKEFSQSKGEGNLDQTQLYNNQKGEYLKKETCETEILD